MNFNVSVFRIVTITLCFVCGCKTYFFKQKKEVSVDFKLVKIFKFNLSRNSFSLKTIFSSFS